MVGWLEVSEGGVEGEILELPVYQLAKTGAGLFLGSKF